MKPIIVFALLHVLLLSACSQPTPEIVRETVIVTQPPLPTHTVYPTYTPQEPLPTYTLYPTYTPQPPLPTHMPYPTYTKPPKPTNTPEPTSTPTPEFQPQTQKIGPIRDSTRDEEYTVEITLKSIQWSMGDRYAQPKPGNVYAIVDLRVKNLGPGPNRYVGLGDFKVLDANGRLIDDDYETIIKDCDFEVVDLIAGGSAEGCFLFEVPSSGQVDLIYAPYKYEGLEPGRYLSFNLRQ